MNKQYSESAYDEFGFSINDAPKSPLPLFIPMDKMAGDKEEVLYKVLDYYIYRDMFTILLQNNVKKIL